MALERWRVLGIVGGIVGLASLFMPWFAFTVTGLFSGSIGFSPVDFVRLVTGAASAVGAPTTNATSPSSSSLGATRILVVTGGALVGSGSIVAILYRLRGGIVMLVGAGLGLLGGVVAPFLEVSGLSIVVMGPSWGVAVGFLGAFIVLAGIWVPERESLAPQETENPEKQDVSAGKTN